MQSLLGAAVVAIALLILVDGGPTRRRLVSRGLPLTERARVGIMGALTLASLVFAAPAVFPPLRAQFFSFCGTCPVPGTAETASASAAAETFLLGAWYYAASVLPVFVVACAISGAIVANARLHIGGIFRAFALAAVLPLCSCGVIPLGKAMIDRGGTSARSGLMFIAAAPLLSPIVIALGASVFGARYVGVRIVASFAMALAVALVVPRFLPTAVPSSAPQPERAGISGGSTSCDTPAHGGSALLAGWGMLTGLFRYVLYGAVVGAAFAALLPPEFLERILGTGSLSMATAVVVGVPVNLCAGEEILLTAPLAGMGLTAGHAVAFALAGTGICVSALPLLHRALGRSATLAMLALYLTIPFLLGVVIDAIPSLRTLAALPF